MLAPEINDCRILEWDSRFFGFNIGRIQPNCLSHDLLATIDLWRRDHDVRCICFLADPDDYETARLAAARQMVQVDVRVTLRAKPVTGLSHARERKSIRFFAAEDLDPLKQIAAAAHRDSRFFFDRLFPQDRSRALFERWIERSCSDSRGRVLVPELNGKPAGYAACRLASETEGQIDLFAVAEWAGRQGLGTALLSAAMDWFASAGARQVSVVTQLRNVRAQRLYQRAGFQLISAQPWYHWWL